MSNLSYGGLPPAPLGSTYSAVSIVFLKSSQFIILSNLDNGA
ncbi:MAG: hypothetical protein QNK68_03805 [Flavobacteriales bacterium]